MLNPNRARRTLAIGALVVAIVGTGLVGCSVEEPSSDADPIVIWSLEVEAPRIAIAKEAAAAFSDESGIPVEVVGVAEDQFPQLITAAAAAGDMPDVVGALTLGGVWSMAGNDLIDKALTAEALEKLDRETFSPAALSLVSEGDDALAIPSDGFAFSVVYRTDLFEQAGLAAPTSYEAILDAAKTLDGPDLAGFVSGTDPDTSFTQAVFEYFALANGCQLIAEDGTPSADSPECVAALTAYETVTTQYSVTGGQDSTSTKTLYMAGDAAMTIWASGILDEMAGLVNDALPTCEECVEDPLFIAHNSGFVTALSGADGTAPISSGDITSFAIPTGADPRAVDAVDYFMSDGYLDWLSQTPEAKAPTRSGPTPDSDEYVTGWGDLEVGVDSRANLTDIYRQEDLDAFQSSVGELQRWGFSQGQGEVVGTLSAQFVVSRAIAALAAGEVDVDQAVAQIQSEATEIQATLE